MSQKVQKIRKQKLSPEIKRAKNKSDSNYPKGNPKISVR